MRKRIQVIASEESYNNLSTFTDLEDMNKTIRLYRDEIRTAVKRADVQARLITLLEVLKRHSSKQIGVSYMCKNTIANLMELSYKTVQRLMKKLEDLGIIRQIAMKRKKDMLQTANAILIQPLKEEVSDKIPHKETEKCPTIKTTSPSLKQKNNKEIRKDVPSTNSVDKSVDNVSTANFVAHWVPERFANLVACFYSDAPTIQELWKIVKQLNRVVNHTTGERAFTADEELQIGIRAMKDFVMKVKKGVTIKNMFGYFNGIVDNIMDKLFFDMN